MKKKKKNIFVVRRGLLFLILGIWFLIFGFIGREMSMDSVTLITIHEDGERTKGQVHDTSSGERFDKYRFVYFIIGGILIIVSFKKMIQGDK